MARKLSIRCQETDCSAVFKTIEDLTKHLSQDHNLKEFEECIHRTFTSKLEFKQWLSSEEKEAQSKFIIKPISKKRKDHNNQLLVCHRSGSYYLKSKAYQRQLAQGSVKIGHHCPARIEIREHPSKVDVTYFKTHYKHDDNDPYRLIIRQKEKQIIADFTRCKFNTKSRISATPTMASDSSITPNLLLNPREKPEDALYRELSATLIPQIKTEPEDFDIDSSTDSKPQVLPDLHCLPMVLPLHTLAAESFTCFMCSARFPSKSALDAHLLIHPEENPFSCDQCGEGFQNESDMVTHRLKHDSRQRSFGRLPFKQAPKLLPVHKYHVCDVCQMVYARESSLKQHQLRHKVKPFFCGECGRSFGNQASLTHHQKFHKDLSQCPICDKTVLTMFYSHHLGEHKNTCGGCEKAFKCKADLVRHRRTCKKEDSEEEEEEDSEEEGCDGRESP